MFKIKILFLVSVLLFVANESNACTETTAGGTKAPAPGSFCKGQLIFEDNFDDLDHSKWWHAATMSGSGNNEFQWYVNDRSNSYTSNGVLHIVPTFTSDKFGEGFLSSGRAQIPERECTDSNNWGCDRTGSPDNIINPIRSARLSTLESFYFKYGTVEIRAKMPGGDWLWPALWMLPKKSVYGSWPKSGEIDIMESRGNRRLYEGNTHVGTERLGSTLHYGPAWNKNGWQSAHAFFNQVPGFNDNFHNYKFIWHPGYLQFWVDGNHILTVDANDGFWARGGFSNSGEKNPWEGRPAAAPFDQEFYLIMNLAVGGTGYFPDNLDNGRNGGKPWNNGSPPGKARTDFWNGRSQWEPSWHRSNDYGHLQIDYVRVWAL